MALSLPETAMLISCALREHDVRAMRKINDRCVQETAIKFEQHTYLFALITYVLSKILSKPRYLNGKEGPKGKAASSSKLGNAKASLASIASLLHSCESYAKEADYNSLLSCQNKVLSAIEKLDDKDRRFVKGILHKGRLKIASTLYAQGLSLGSAAEMTGTDKRELLSYAGQTMMFDRVKEKKGIEERMRDLREIFS